MTRRANRLSIVLEADRQLTNRESERGKRKAISLSKEWFESYRKRPLDDEIQAEIERRVELKWQGRSEKASKEQELNQLREKTGRQEREIISYKNRILVQNKELEELRQNDNREVH